MNNFNKLLIGEVKRLIAYKILPISFVTSFVWIIIYLFITKDEAIEITPLLIFVDISMMSILLIGASSHLEKQDGTIKTMMVMPVTIKEILMAKILASLVLGLQSAFIISIALYIIHGVILNYFLLLLFIVIAGIAHAILGFLFSFISKDFTSMLGIMMAYMLPFAIPTILFSFGVINKKYEWILMLSPSHSSSHLITSSVIGEYELIKVIIGVIYLILLSFILLKFIVYPKFKNYAVRG